VRDCEKKVKDRLADYTSKIRRTGMEGLAAREDDEEFVEENVGGLLDSICESNRAYMKKGMKLGAGMVFQLLGL